MEDCIFCKIIEGTIPSRKAFENDRVLAFHDIEPAAPVHILVVPKKHIATLNEVTAEDGILIAELIETARNLAVQFDIAESGYRLINNCNSDGGQTCYHLHFHLLGGKKLGPLIQGHVS